MNLPQSQIRGLIFALCLFGAVAPLHAKRGPAPTVAPVVIGPVRYSAPPKPQLMGFVIATDIRSGKELWRQRIYRVFIDPFLEKDVQWVFITSLVQQGQILRISNERGERFSLDLRTRKISKLR